MNKYFSDYLPPALVRDLRRSWRTRGYIAMLALAMVAAVWLQYSVTKAESVTSATGWSAMLLGLATLVMWCVIPNRAGAAVSADAKVKGTNFMMLTPLSSRSIVWGTWVSAVLQLLVLAGLGACLLCWRHSTEVVQPLTDPLLNALSAGGRIDARAFAPALTHQQEWIIFGLIVGGGIVLCAAFMCLAQLSRFFRFGATTAVLIIILGQVMEAVFTTAWLTDENYSPLSDFLDAFSGVTLWVRVADAVLAICLLLELARRSYAAPAENCSRAVRLLTLLPLVSVPALHYLLPGELKLFEEQANFCACFCLLATLSDALLPTYSLPAHNKRCWPLLPNYLQTPGLGQASLFLLLVYMVCCGLSGWAAGKVSMMTMSLSDVSLAIRGGYVLLAGLLVTDLLTSRRNINRPIVFGLVVVVFSVLGTVARFSLPQSVQLYVLALLPGGGNEIMVFELAETQEAMIACCISGAALLLTLAALMWRGRKS